MIRKTAKIHFFILTEMVMALGLMMVLFVCYFTSVKTIDKMDKAFTNDTRALQTVSNTVERLEHKKQYSCDDIKRIFMDEFCKSGFSENSRIVPYVKINVESADLALIKANGKAIIEVQIKCRK
jgi:uncharacterized protein (UPF0335 family)